MKPALMAIVLPLVVLAPVVSAGASFWDRWTLASQGATFAWPIGGPSHYTVRNDPYGLGAFGARRSGGRTHNGIDLAAPVGATVRAAGAGRARQSRQPRGMGAYVEIVHGNGCVTLYGHLSRVLVADGQWVLRGEPIGLVGKSGNARRRAIQPHLHFELRLQGVPVDPLDGYLEEAG